SSLPIWWERGTASSAMVSGLGSKIRLPTRVFSNHLAWGSRLAALILTRQSQHVTSSRVTASKAWNLNCCRLPSWLGKETCSAGQSSGGLFDDARYTVQEREKAHTAAS